MKNTRKLKAKKVIKMKNLKEKMKEAMKEGKTLKPKI